jgi:hypothetical protein
VSDVITETEARPTESPPEAGDGNGAGTGTGTVAPPRELDDLAGQLFAGAAAAAGTGEAEPTLQPPTAAVTGDGVGLWVSNKQIDALYSTYAARFSWMHVAGGVWRRFSPVSDSGVAALALLAAHARDRGRPVNYREEADQLVHEMYVW